MRLGIGHGPRLHLNLFGARCRWPCIQQTASSIGSMSTHSSLLDNDYTSSWTYIQYAHSRAVTNYSDHTGSTLNDTELISLLNDFEGDVLRSEGADGAASSQNSNERGAALPWVNSNDRHARRDVRTLFPEDAAVGGAHGGGSGRFPDGNNLGGVTGAMADCQYVNFPLARDQSTLESVPFYTAGRSSSHSSSNHGSLRPSISELLELDTQLHNTPESGDWATGGDHPYGIPSSLLGGVLLNLDNQFRLSANTEWQNWGEFLTSAREPGIGGTDSTGSRSGTYENAFTFNSNQNQDEAGACSNCDSNDLNNSLNNENTTFENIAPADEENAGDILPSIPFPPRGFLHRQFTLPPPPSSNASTRSSGSGSTRGPRQQDWYFYDPRLVPGQRTERVTLDTSFRGLQNRCNMSSIIQPPAYDEIMQQEEVPGGEAAIGALTEPPPPPYTETEPPPSYDQSFSHTLALPTFQIGSLPVNPLERRLAASLCSSPLVLSAALPEPDLLTDVNIDELLDGPLENDNEIRSQDRDVLWANDHTDEEDEEEEGVMDESMSGEEAMENEDEDVAPPDGEAENSRFSPRRYPVGFCLGRRPPLRWSRGMAPNRWTPTENWASQ